MMSLDFLRLASPDIFYSVFSFTTENTKDSLSLFNEIYEDSKTLYKFNLNKKDIFGASKRSLFGILTVVGDVIFNDEKTIKIITSFNEDSNKFDNLIYIMKCESSMPGTYSGLAEAILFTNKVSYEKKSFDTVANSLFIEEAFA